MWFPNGLDVAPMPLAGVAWHASRDDIEPADLTAIGARNDMVEGEILGRVLVAAILATKIIAQKEIHPGEWNPIRLLDVILQGDHRGWVVGDARRAQDSIVGFENDDALLENFAHSARKIPDRQRIGANRRKIRIQDQCGGRPRS